MSACAHFRRPHFALRRLVALAFVIGSAAPAAAQSRFSLELDTGFDLPLSASVHNAISLSADEASADDATGTPLLVNRLNRPGFHVSVTALLSSLELRYGFERFAWRGARVTCRGDRDATRLPNGEIQDAEVEYDCRVPDETVHLDDEDGSALTFHHLSAGRRFFLQRTPRATTWEGATVERDLARLYAVASGGLTLAGYRDPNIGRRLKPGLNLGGGVGTELPIDRRMSIVVDLRYTLSMVAGSSTPSARARRANAADRNVVAALLDVYHRVGLNLGFRFDFR